MKSRKALALAVFCFFTTGVAFAKLPSPPLSDEQKAKAAEAAKTEAEQLAKAQDRVVDSYVKAQKAKGVTVKPTPIAAAPAPAAAAAPAKK